MARLRLLAVYFLSTVEPLCLSQCLFGTIFGCPVFDGVGLRVFREEPMLSRWPNLLSLLLFSVFLPSMGWLYEVGLRIDGVFSLSRPCTIDSILILIVIIIIILGNYVCLS